MEIFIGDRDYHWKGYGTEALRLLLHYAFNEQALKSCIEAGFKEMGRRRSAVQRNGKEYDVIFINVTT